jgi:transketolase
MMRAVHGSTVLYPCDGNQTAKLVAAMADLRGISYIRTTRANTAILYPPEEEFPIGGSRVVRGGDADDRVTVVAAGITVHESLKAADELAKGGIKIRLIDAYSVKPLDAGGIAKAVRETGGRLVIVEDHWPEGGLGDAVVAGLVSLGVKDIVLRHLAVRDMPTSGKPAELLEAAGIAARDIAAAVRALLA